MQAPHRETEARPLGPAFHGRSARANCEFAHPGRMRRQARGGHHSRLVSHAILHRGDGIGSTGLLLLIRETTSSLATSKTP